jgi:chromosomal replication initiation ATPase DnaA
VNAASHSAGAGMPLTDEWGRELRYRWRVDDDIDAEYEARLAAVEAELAAARAQRQQRDADALLAAARSSQWVQRLAVSVADEWDVPVSALLGRQRVRVITRPRFMLVWLVRTVAPDYSLPRIAAAVNYDDHTSVIHALGRVEQWRRDDERLVDLLDRMAVIGKRMRSESRPAPLLDAAKATAS